MHEKTEKTNKRIRPPHPFVMIFVIMLFAVALTFIVPLGRYELREAAYTTGNPATSNIGASVDPYSFRYVMDENNDRVVDPVPMFGLSLNNEQGMMNFLFSGLDNSRNAAGTAGLIAYLLVIGGSFGVLMRTGVVDQGVLFISSKTENISTLLPPILFILFSFQGAAFGFSEVAVPLSMLIIPLLIALNFDAITGVLVTFAAMQIGISLSWMSPLALADAQTIAGIPVFSGARLRILLWIVFTALGAIYTTVYALRVQSNPRLSAVQATDARCRGRLESLRQRQEPFSTGSYLILLVIALTLFWMLWGTLTSGYRLSEIASIFFIMAFICGLLGAFFHLDGMRFSDIPRAFQAGASEFVGAALVVGMAQGTVLLLGGISPVNASVLNTVLHWTQRLLSQLSGVFSSWLMFLCQFGFNFIVPSDGGQAALTMPVMAPLADTLGISRQVSVLAFQLGGSLSHLIAPTSGCLIGVLSVARVEWGDWLRSQWRALAVVFGAASCALMLAAAIGYV